jgi:alginate export protein
MRSLTKWSGLISHSLTLAAATLVACMQLLVSPAFAGYELPPGERITNLPHIPRSMPQKEGYESYDPVIGRNFDLKNFWMRADLRVRPEFRNNVCFGGGPPAAGACTTLAGARANAPVNTNQGGQTKSANDFYVQQWVRLGLGYDLSPDVSFYMEIIDSATWGGNGNPNNAGNGGDPLGHACGVDSAAGGAGTQSNCRLGVRAAYVLVRNLGGVQGLSMKAGRQYVIFGNHSLFGHFDWANTGYSHDGIMFQYATKAFESHLGWFRNSETDLTQGTAVGSGAGNIAGNAAGAGPANGMPDGGRDVDMFIFYNQFKSIPGILFEPYYVLYLNGLHETANAAQGMGTPKKSNQIRHMIGQRSELRKGGLDFILETAWQFGKMADGIGTDNSRNVNINAWALRTWLGYTVYSSKLKPRFAVNLDWASGDGDANCATAATCSSAGGTFENFFPTNHIHMAYADVQAWKNMFAPQLNFQMRPSARDHFEIWYMNMNLANARDNWYRAGQGPYIFTRNDNTKKHVGDEIDFSWTRMFADGKVAFQATYGHIFTGGYMTANMPTSPVNQSWGFVQLWMNF